MAHCCSAPTDAFRRVCKAEISPCGERRACSTIPARILPADNDADSARGRRRLGSHSPGTLPSRGPMSVRRFGCLDSTPCRREGVCTP